MKNFIYIAIIMVLGSCINKKHTNIDLKLDKAQLSGGELFTIDSFPSKYVRPRNVSVWLPNNYSNNKKYAVLYMHDGQMLFDAKTTWNKQEWKADECATKLMNKGEVKDFIIVGIWNIAAIRHNDYFPKKPLLGYEKEVQNYFKASKLELKVDEIYSDNYLKFLVQELKPYIDKNFSVYTDKNNTAIMGSSMGGLISMYAICEYPDVFGAAACLSTHWIGAFTTENNPIPQLFFDYMDKNLPPSKTHQMYFDYGTETLDKNYLPYQQQVSNVLNKNGYTINRKFEGENHSENSWSKRLEIPFTFLMKK